jgi:hypothetical protein
VAGDEDLPVLVDDIPQRGKGVSQLPYGHATHQNAPENVAL